MYIVTVQENNEVSVYGFKHSDLEKVYDLLYVVVPEDKNDPDGEYRGSVIEIAYRHGIDYLGVKVDVKVATTMQEIIDNPFIKPEDREYMYSFHKSVIEGKKS